MNPVNRPLQALVALIVVAFVILFIITTFIPYEPAREAASKYFTEEEIDLGLLYTFQRRFYFWGWTAIELGLLGILALTPLGRRLADRALALTRQRYLLAALVLGLGYFTVNELLYIPMGVARLYHSQSWGMSNHTLETWLQERAIGMGLALVRDAILIGGFYLLLIILPRTWWLVAPLGAAGLAILYASFAPILIDPLFNDFTPLSQTEWKDMEPRVRKLIDDADVPVGEILVMNASRQTNHSNAYFTGFGGTRRIVLYDTLLKKNTPDQIESVLAHELGHWLHDHIVKGILLGMIAALVGFYIIDRSLRFAVGRSPWQLQSISDPGGLFLVLLLVHLGNWSVAPVQNAVSRHFEQQADAKSLEMVGRPDVFIRSEVTISRDNIANVAPTPWNVWLFASHPPAVERIRMAEEWKNR